MTLPPQAYTRDILIKAYEWFREQSSLSPAIKEKAKDADSLVALYMQSRRRTSQDNWEQKVSEETFKNDLRHLAEDLKQFEDLASPPQKTMPAPSSIPQRILEPQPIAASASNVAASTKSSYLLDERSLKMAREIQNRFNLSNEHEAIRMLVVMGYEKLFPMLNEMTPAP